MAYVETLEQINFQITEDKFTEPYKIIKNTRIDV